MAEPKKLEDPPISSGFPNPPAISRRHRPVVAELDVPDDAKATGRFYALSSNLGSIGRIGRIEDEVRGLLWEVVHGFLLAPTGRPAVRRVWASPPISGAPERMPEDVAQLLEGWFSLVEPVDVFAFLESVHDNLDAPNQQRYALACNGALERGCSDRRFVARRLVPISSRTDIVTIERALLACKPSHMADAETHFLDALDRFAQKNANPDFKGAVEEAIRAVEEATFVLTGERAASLDDALEDLESKGFVDPTMKAAYGGLSTYVASLGFNAQTASGVIRKTTQDDARLILVMCAGFLSHLATKM